MLSRGRYVVIPRDFMSGQCLGYAFAEYENPK